MRTLSNGTFDRLKIYELITCFLFSTRISLYKNRNTTLNTLMLILTLKNIRIRDRYQLFKKLLLNFSPPPKTNLETNFTKSLKRDNPFYPQLT